MGITMINSSCEKDDVLAGLQCSNISERKTTEDVEKGFPLPGLCFSMVVLSAVVLANVYVIQRHQRQPE